jgi:hypothetical protein
MYLQARILFHEKEYTRAQESLEMALDIDPDFELAKDLLTRTQLLSGWGSFMQNFQQRKTKRRAAMQTKLTTTDVTLDMALNLFNREVQGSMARVITPEGRWSGLKKKELHEYLVHELQEAFRLQQIVDALNGEERDALRAVVTRGGTMPWSEFDQQYGNDLAENPDWQYHAPTTLMGHLRQRGLLAEAKVKDQLLIVVPTELRQPLAKIL